MDVYGQLFPADVDPGVVPKVAEVTSVRSPSFDPTLSIETVKYEYDMAVATASLMLQHRAKSQYSAAEGFALPESFLVHARNLHDFLKPQTEKALRERATRPRSQYSGSVWACDFVLEFGVETFDSPTIASIDRWLQHITTWRQEDDGVTLDGSTCPWCTRSARQWTSSWQQTWVLKRTRR